MRQVSIVLGLLCLLLALPVISLASAWLALDAAALEVLRHQFTTVLPDYTRGSLVLAVAVGVGVAMVGTGAAVAVTLFDFPGRRLFELTLLLPLAMPAYVLAYVYTDTLQSSGALQVWLRELTGARGALWPDVRSLWGAVILFVLALYPYVYLLTRTALAGRGSTLLEAARLLGAGLVRRIVTIALPLARPAIAAGVSLALMETLADYGVGAYFGLQTYTTGIYRAWLSFGDRLAAAQLATVLLLVVGLLAWAEQHAQARLRYATTRPAGRGADAQPLRLHGLPAAIAVFVCALPVLAGFVIPVLLLLRLVAREAMYGEFGLPWERFLGWSWTTLQLAGTAAALAALLALALSLALRWRPAPLLQAGVRVVSLGYAVPGAVIAIGLLLPAGWLQAHFPQSTWGTLLTSTTLGLVYAYLVRFSAVALQSVQAGMSRLPTSLDESGRMLGAGPLRLFLQVHGPLLLPSVLGAALLVFVDVMKELPATLVLRPFDSDTLAVVAYQLARDERLAEAALPSLAIVAVGLIPVLMLARAIRRADR